MVAYSLVVTTPARRLAVCGAEPTVLLGKLIVEQHERPHQLSRHLVVALGALQSGSSKQEERLHLGCVRKLRSVCF